MGKVFLLGMLTGVMWGQVPKLEGIIVDDRGNISIPEGLTQTLQWHPYQTLPAVCSNCVLPTKPNTNSWKWSVVGLSAATALDIGSSWGREELNPVLGRGTFGTRQAGVKLGIVGGSVLTEWLWLRHHPQHTRVMATVNVGATGLTVGVAIRNFKLR